MSKKFSVSEMDEMNSSKFLSMSDLDKAHERVILRSTQVEHLLNLPAFRHVMARVKRKARDVQDMFFSGSKVLPNGLENASPREAYCAGLVNCARALLDLQREMHKEAQENEKDTETQGSSRPAVEPEESPFGDEPVSTFSPAGDGNA